MVVAQITDMHVKRRGFVLPHMPHVIGPLRRALAAIVSLREQPACVIATGDLTEHGQREEYERLRDILAEVDVPVYLLPGNHDRRAEMRAVFTDAEYLHGQGKAVLFTIESERLRLVALDTSEAPRQGGYLDDRRLRWLDERLGERRDTPTILAMHHPPFKTGLFYFDDQPFAGVDLLGEIVRRHPQVRRIICGHVHQVIERNWNGALAVSSPSTAPSLVVRPNSRGVSLEPGGFLLHRIDDRGVLRTHLVRTPPDVIALGA